MPDYPYEGQLIADPVSFQRAVSAQVTVYDADDATNTTPLALKDASGLPTSNPLTSSSDAFVKPIYAPSQDIKYVGAGLTVFVSSPKGMRDAAAAAALAAQEAANSAVVAVADRVTTAAVDGAGKLILTKANGSTLDAGSVIGPVGPTGAAGANGSNVLPTNEAIAQAVTTDGPAKTALSTTYAPMRALESVSRNNDRTGVASPKFARQGTVAAAAATGSPKIGFPKPIRVDNLISSPLNNYYAFTSDDHGSGPGGIHLWHFAEHGDQWTYVAKVLTHPEAGALQVESGYVVWDQATLNFRCYAQVQGTVIGKIAGQITCVWTSPDGQTWSYAGISHDVENVNDMPQTGGTHTGYQEVSQVGGMWVSRGLVRGAQTARWGTYYSQNGLKFYHDRSEDAGCQDWAPAGRLVHLFSFIEWNGTPYGVGQSRQNLSGGATGTGDVVMGRVNQDLTGFSGNPDVVYTPPSTGTGDNGDIQSACVVIEKGIPHLYYHATGSHIIYAKGN